MHPGSRPILGRSVPGFLSGALAALAMCSFGVVIGCGGGDGSSNPTEYTLTVNSSNPSSGVSISYNFPNSPSLLVPAPGTTSFTLTESSGTVVALTVPSTASNGNIFSSWTGCTSTSGTSNSVCSVTLSANATVTANYATSNAVAPTVTVTPSSLSIGTAQSLNVTIAVAGSNGGTTPTGSVALTSGSYTSAAATLTSGSATITIPANSLAVGTATLKASYTPDSASSSLYTSASGTASVTVTSGSGTLPAPTMTLTPSSTGITTAQSLGVTVAVSGNPTPTGSVVLTGGGYTSPAVTLSSGSASINVAAGALAAGSDTLTATYTPDSNSSSTYSSGSATASVTVTAVDTLAVATTNPASGVALIVTQGSNTSIESSPFTVSYTPGTALTVTAPASSGTNNFTSWSGCTSVSGPADTICSITLSANTTVTATYGTAGITISPSGGSVTIGSTQQFTATVTGESNTAVTWSVAIASAPTGFTGDAGSISTSGLYQTPYPAPTTITVTATSVANSSLTATANIMLSPPATAAGPALSVDANAADGNPANPNCKSGAPCPISPLIYGMNAYLLDTTTAASANISIARWGGDDTSRYNYQNNIVNSANDYYFENFAGASSMLGGGSFSGFLSTAAGVGSAGIKTIATAPLIGYVSNSTVQACSFPQSTYPGQTAYNGTCGNGYYPQGTNGCTSTGGCAIAGNASTPALTSIAAPPPSAPGAGNATTLWAASTWTGAWVGCILSNSSYCTSGGEDATIWDLDNEPGEWDAVHRDVHPLPQTYDELTDAGIGTALAIKVADPNAQVSGPIIDLWWNYFYSKQDIESGYSSGPCSQPWDNPTDREAHNGTPMIEYYLQQMAQASSTYGMRLLDYVDIHAYLEGSYNGAQVGLQPAGNTGEQEARLNSARVFWDPTYTDPNYPQPNYKTDANYTSSCNVPALAPEVIPMMQSWIAAAWTPNTTYAAPGTAIDEYNFGGLESINGALTEADILGIFGKYGLTLATLWPTTNYSSQGPGNMAFEVYRNYDGSKSTFGDSELNSTTGDQSQLSVYAGVRGSNATPDDNAVTIVVINKTYGTLTSTLSIDNLTGSPTSAQVYQYTGANLTAIVAQPAAAITPPASGSTTSTISATFPVQSITLFVIPQ